MDAPILGEVYNVYSTISIAAIALAWLDPFSPSGISASPLKCIVMRLVVELP
jgi:hypothetical protein